MLYLSFFFPFPFPLFSPSLLLVPSATASVPPVPHHDMTMTGKHRRGLEPVTGTGVAGAVISPRPRYSMLNIKITKNLLRWNWIVAKEGIKPKIRPKLQKTPKALASNAKRPPYGCHKRQRSRTKG